MDVWSGDLQLAHGQALHDIHLFSNIASTGVNHLIPTNAILRFVAIVQVSEVPLCLVAGPSYLVWTGDAGTRDWLTDNLLLEPSVDPPSSSWYDYTGQSYCGILCTLHDPTSNCSERKATQIMFYAIGDRNHESGQQRRGQYHSLLVRAVPLCPSKPRPGGIQPSPPLSPVSVQHATNADTFVAQFVEDDIRLDAAQNDSQDVFTKANELRRRAKGIGGVGVARAAAGISQARLLVGHKKPKTKDASQSGTKGTVDKQSKYPETMKSRSGQKDYQPLSMGATIHNRKTSTGSVGNRKVSRTTSLPDQREESAVEQANKDVISRLVMAGMRLYGLQRKKSEAEQETPTSQDIAIADEYKLVYHQTYRAAAFAFRCHMNTPLHHKADLVRETVDSLLAIFCSTPTPE